MGIANAPRSGAPAPQGTAHPSVDDLIKSVSVALITSIDATGIMHTRQLPNTNTECNAELWFLSSMSTPLVQEVQANPDVLVTYADRGTSRFVVVNGVVQVKNDPERIRALWHPVLASWLPGGPDDPSLALLQVSVKGIDLWE
jgi:general stress protein 26